MKLKELYAVESAGRFMALEAGDIPYTEVEQYIKGFVHGFDLAKRLAATASPGNELSIAPIGEDEIDPEVAPH